MSGAVSTRPRGVTISRNTLDSEALQSYAQQLYMACAVTLVLAAILCIAARSDAAAEIRVRHGGPPAETSAEWHAMKLVMAGIIAILALVQFTGVKRLCKIIEDAAVIDAEEEDGDQAEPGAAAETKKDQ